MKTMYNNDYLYGSYRNLTFADVYPNYELFNEEYTNSPLAVLTENIEQLYYLLYAKYGNNPICNSDINQFKYRLFSTIYSYGPTWSKRLNIQKQIRELSIEEIAAGSKAIYNRALNPGTAPSTSTLEELTYINEQNTTNYKKSKIEALSFQYELLETTVTEDFLNKFKPLFLTFVSPELDLLYGG